jgi:hypothetical protein
MARARSGGRASGWVWIESAAVVAALLVVVVVVAVRQGGDRGPQTSDAALTNPPATVAVGGDAAPPWPAPKDAAAALRAAGLPMLGSEGNVEHIHAISTCRSMDKPFRYQQISASTEPVAPSVRCTPTTPPALSTSNHRSSASSASASSSPNGT